MTSNQTIAQTILEQLGGNRFAAMTGAKDVLAVEGGLQFKVGANASGINRVRVILDLSDTYTVTFYRITKRGLGVEVKHEASDVYADDLRELFEATTGLYTSL